MFWQESGSLLGVPKAVRAPDILSNRSVGQFITFHRSSLARTGVASSPSSSSVALKLHNTRRQRQKGERERQTARHKNSDSSVLSEHRRKETKNNNPTRSSESSSVAQLIRLRWTMEYASRVPYLIASFVRCRKVKLTLRLSDPNPISCSSR